MDSTKPIPEGYKALNAGDNITSGCVFLNPRTRAWEPVKKVGGKFKPSYHWPIAKPLPTVPAFEALAANTEGRVDEPPELGETESAPTRRRKQNSMPTLADIQSELTQLINEFGEETPAASIIVTGKELKDFLKNRLQEGAELSDEEVELMLSRLHLAKDSWTWRQHIESAAPMTVKAKFV